MCLHFKPLYFVIFLMMFANLSKAEMCGPEFDQQKPAKTSIEIDASQTDDEKSVFIYFDQSLSMQGFTKLQPGEDNYYIDLLDDLQQIAENVGSKTFYHSFGKRIEPIKQNKIAQVTKPTFYECEEATASCNNQESKIHLPFRQAEDISNGTFIIVTDLFLSNKQLVSTSRTQLTKPLKSILKNGKSIGIIGVMNSFNGTIYDIPTREGGTISFTEAKKRPFYVIVIGDQKEINKVKKNLEEQHFDGDEDKYKFTLVTSTPVLQNLNQSELISENNISQNITKSENFKLEFEKDKLPIYFFNAKRKNKSISLKFDNSDIIVPGSTGVSEFKINNTLWSSHKTKCRKIDHDNDWKKDKRTNISTLEQTDENLEIEIFKEIPLKKLFWGKRYFYFAEIYAQSPGNISEETFKEWSISDAEAESFTENNPTEYKTLNLDKIIKILNSVANEEFTPTLIASIALNFELEK